MFVCNFVAKAALYLGVGVAFALYERRERASEDGEYLSFYNCAAFVSLCNCVCLFGHLPALFTVSFIFLLGI